MDISWGGRVRDNRLTYKFLQCYELLLSNLYVIREKQILLHNLLFLKQFLAYLNFIIRCKVT